jgi:hypothetical protein
MLTRIFVCGGPGEAPADGENRAHVRVRADQTGAVGQSQVATNGVAIRQDGLSSHHQAALDAAGSRKVPHREDVYWKAGIWTKIEPALTRCTWNGERGNM